jgi:TBC1 domain family member 20
LVSVFLLVLEDDHLAFAIAEVVSRDFISDFMNCDFEVIGKSMKLLFVIIKAADSVLYRFLMESGIEPFFATSWLLTWFSHDFPTISDAARLFDAMLCSHPSFSYYLCAAVSWPLIMQLQPITLFEILFLCVLFSMLYT